MAGIKPNDFLVSTNTNISNFVSINTLYFANLSDYRYKF